MSRFDFDLFTIGAGSGGVRASRVSAGYGARVAVAEERYLGGTCVNVGCIPKKLLVHASEYRHAFEDAAAYGWTVGERSVDWPKLIANKDREIDRLNGVYRRLLDDAGVTLFEDRAGIVDPHTVEVNGRRYTSRTLLVATGSWPVVPDVPGSEHVITSNDAFYLDEAPKRVLIVGGGYIGVEFAGIFHGLGSTVTLVHRGDVFLRGFDDDLRWALADEMQKQGIDLHFRTTVERIEKTDSGLRTTLSTGDTLEVDQILCATGRAPNTRGFGLEDIDVELDAEGAVVVDDYSCSSQPSVYAIGDCTNRMNLTPVAIHEGQTLARTLFDDSPTKPDYRFVPSCVFSQPNLGTVGLTEAEARHESTSVEVYQSTFRPLKHSLTGRDEKTLMKLVVDAETDRVVGLHMVGPDAGEIVQGFAVALKCGATKAQFDATVGIHPTAAEEFVTMRNRK